MTKILSKDEINTIIDALSEAEEYEINRSQWWLENGDDEKATGFMLQAIEYKMIKIKLKEIIKF